jgi:TetR/AcrR family tetracycline transcriptional repressor
VAVAPRPLSRKRILQTAFAIADKEGLEAVTMRSVAAKLGVEAMSLYHYVPNKRAMMDGLVDELVQVAAFPTGQMSAEQWIRGAATGLRALAQQHPRLVPLFNTRAVPLNDPLSAQTFEDGLAAFGREGYGVGEGFAALQAVALALLSMTHLEATATMEVVPEESSLEGLPEADFPLLNQVQESGAGLEDFWRVLVDALVKGLKTP